eukprot:6144010-Prymnesium_polylepis.1
MVPHGRLQFGPLQLRVLARRGRRLGALDACRREALHREVEALARQHEERARVRARHRRRARHVVDERELAEPLAGDVLLDHGVALHRDRRVVLALLDDVELVALHLLLRHDRPPLVVALEHRLEPACPSPPAGGSPRTARSHAVPSAAGPAASPSCRAAPRRPVSRRPRSGRATGGPYRGPSAASYPCSPAATAGSHGVAAAPVLPLPPRQ